MKLGSFLDQRYKSVKKLSINSVFLFLVPTVDPADTVLVKAEPSKMRFVVYDPLKGRKSCAFADKVDLLRPFIADYLDNFKPSKLFTDEQVGEQERDGEEESYFDDSLADSVQDWPI